MVKKVFLLLITLFTIHYSLFAAFAYAQAATAEDSFTTKVGNPSGPPPNLTPGETNDLVKAGTNLVAAYNACGGGSTRSSNSRSDCLSKQLKSSGYADDVVKAFQTRLSSAEPSGCVECVGFVALSLSLTTGSSSALLSNIGSAAAVYKLNSFTANKTVYQLIGEGNSAKIQGGDIAVKDSDPKNSAGHIAIVNAADPKGLNFYTIESNRNFDCRVTIGDPKDPSTSYVKEGFRFYRKQAK